MLNRFNPLLRRKFIRSLGDIKFLVFDVDGVLTDGGLWYDSSGTLQKRFDVRDGLGIRLLKQAGLQLAFLSGGKPGATEVRAKQLGIEHCLVEIQDKSLALQGLQQSLDFTKEQTAYVGDDLNDLVVRNLVKLFIVPSDSSPIVCRKADFVLRRPGGHGAVRELSEYILEAHGMLAHVSENGFAQRNDT